MKTNFILLQKEHLPTTLIVLFSAFWLYCFAFAIDYTDWWLENILVFAGVAWLSFPTNRSAFSKTGLILIFLFMCLHVYGAKMAYTMTELGEYLQNCFSLDRNPYDRIVHFSFGLLLLVPMYEVISARMQASAKAGLVVANMAILCGAAAFELIEWGVAAFFDSATGESYVATQGDIWDAQKDIALAALGAFLISTVMQLKSRATPL